MNFEWLTWLVDSILNWFSCSHCSAKPEKKDIYIKKIENSSVVIDILCPVCKEHNYVKSEVYALDLTKHLNKEQISALKENFEKQKNISDEEIVKLDKYLKKWNISASDLFE